MQFKKLKKILQKLDNDQNLSKDNVIEKIKDKLQEMTDLRDYLTSKINNEENNQQS